nr:hypothetical protein CFP56_42102 [Quercus suber]
MLAREDALITQNVSDHLESDVPHPTLMNISDACVPLDSVRIADLRSHLALSPFGPDRFFDNCILSLSSPPFPSLTKRRIRSVLDLFNFWNVLAFTGSWKATFLSSVGTL